MEIHSWVTCPYCGYKNTVKVELTQVVNTNAHDVILCNGPNGEGCRKRFVAYSSIQLHISGHEIGGENEP